MPHANSVGGFTVVVSGLARSAGSFSVEAGGACESEGCWGAWFGANGRAAVAALSLRSDNTSNWGRTTGVWDGGMGVSEKTKGEKEDGYLGGLS